MVAVMKVARKSFHPFYIRPLTGIEWWTIYISMSPEVYFTFFDILHVKLVSV